MHELSICIALLEQVGRIASERGAGRVTKIVLEVGPLSGVEGNLLRHAWPLVAAGTVAADADLSIESAEVRVTCTTCGAESAAAPNRLLCGACGDYRTRLIRGDEMILKRLELEDICFTGDDAGASARRLAQRRAGTG